MAFSTARARARVCVCVCERERERDIMCKGNEAMLQLNITYCNSEECHEDNGDAADSPRRFY